MQLDAVDKKILSELFLDGRIPLNELAKKVRVSKEVAKYRLDRLVKNGIITKFIPLLNFSRLGYHIYRVQIKFKEKAINLEELKKNSKISWIVELQGYWDIVILYWIKNNTEFFSIIDEIRQQFGNNIQDMQFTIVQSIHHLGPNFVLDTANEFQHIIGYSEDKTVEISETEIKIIRSLMQDGRKSVLDIAKEIDFSATNVTHHLKKLTTSGLITGFIPIIDHRKLDLSHFKVTLCLNNPSQINSLQQLLLQSKNVIYITKSYGKYDLEFEYITDKIQNLLNFIDTISKEISLKNHEIIFDNREILVNEVPF